MIFAVVAVSVFLLDFFIKKRIEEYFESGGNRKICKGRVLLCKHHNYGVKRLFSTNKEDELALLYSFLTRMGYLQQVKIQAEKGENMSEGYQLELGKGRTYLVKGE